jgi:hypothetical protein
MAEPGGQLRANESGPAVRDSWRTAPKGALSKEGVRPNNRAIPWQQSYAYNHPFLFVIPSEAEESAVRH